MSRMAKAMTKVAMERCLMDMPYEILFEIFRELPKGKLFEISRIPSKLGDVARDKRLWKDVCIKYMPIGQSKRGRVYDVTLAFEELYSGPLPVKVIDMSNIKINPPVSFKTDQVTKVTTLNLSSIRACEVTVEAILAKYQCTELNLNYYDGMRIAPEAFSKQTDLEVLSLKSMGRKRYDRETGTLVHEPGIYPWLAPVLSKYCENLKTLDLNYSNLSGIGSTLVKHLPTSLEKLCLISCDYPGDSFFKLLAERIPNLKDLELLYSTIVRCPSLLEFKFLEALHLAFVEDISVSYYKYLIVLPALKTVYWIRYNQYWPSEKGVESLRTKLNLHDITVVESVESFRYPENGNLWQVSKVM